MFNSFLERCTGKPGTSHGPIRSVIVLLGIVLISGCGMFDKKDDEDGVTKSADELYAEARAELEDTEWEDAIDTLRKLEAEYPYGDHALQAQIDTIYAYYRLGDVGMVKASAARFIKLHPTHESVAYAYYLKGMVSYQEDKSLLGVFMGKDDLSDRDATNMLEALDAFKKSYELFPDSQYAPSARKRAKDMQDALANYEINVAKFYYSRDAHVAAINRAERVIENYSTTPAVEDALAVMMQSYARMGMTDLAADSRRVLELNFPESRYLREDAGIE